MKEQQLKDAFTQVFKDQDMKEVSVIESVDAKARTFFYVQSKDCRLKVFHDNVEVWEKIGTKSPVKTLVLEKPMIQALNKLYETDSIL
jgi:hypothetical protein